MFINWLRKIKWFLKNFKKISSGSKILLNGEEILPPIFLGPITYKTDGLITSNNCDFITEPHFAKAYALAAATKPWSGFTLQWRVYNMCWFADYVKLLPGDFVECGVNTGAYARAIIEYINFKDLDKTFYLLDTFSGLPEQLVNEKERLIGLDKMYKNNYTDVYEEVLKTFAGFNVSVIKGIVPDTLQEVKADRICFLSLDMNMVTPEIAAINFFWDKLVPGGIVMLDDYGFPPHITQKKAFDQFALEKSVAILTMPTGQGIIIKPQ
jgi:O-methyltransferase